MPTAKKSSIGHKDKTKKDVPSLFYKNGVKYEITVNMNDRNQHFDGGVIKKTADISQRLKLCCRSFNNIILKNLHDISTFSFITEISELQYGYKPFGGETMKLPRVHFHGTIEFTDCMTFLFERFKKIANVCSIQINEYRPKYWPYYIVKQHDLIHAYAKKKGVNTLFTKYRGLRSFNLQEWALD